MEEKPLKFINKNEKKVSEKHKQLANYIKGIHSQLRNESEILGANEAWNKHVKRNQELKEYAKSMYELATEHWGKESSEAVTYCRIEWVKNQCKNYFFNGGMKKFDDKEEYLIKKYDIDTNNTEINKEIKIASGSKIKILDVGSCYNPFKTENLFSVTPIDIAPYSEDVIKCDFLNLKIGTKKTFLEKSLIELPKKCFNVVIFSLLLEYIPCPHQRFLCCQKAYDLLNDGGVLFIVTPDSKHEGANCKIINTSWKVVLAKLGFMRISYEKLPHIHCLGFRKCIYKEAAMKNINWKKISEENELFCSTKIHIPQDFQSKNLQSDIIMQDSSNFHHNDQELATLFNELPCED